MTASAVPDEETAGVGYLRVAAAGGEVARSLELEGGIVVDVAADGTIVGVEVLAGPVAVAEVAAVVARCRLEPDR